MKLLQAREILCLCVVWSGKPVVVDLFETGFPDFAGQTLRNLNGFGDRSSFSDSGQEHSD